MSRKAFADRSSWKTASIHAFSGDYGPFKPRAGPIEDVLILLKHDDDGNDGNDNGNIDNEGRHAMYSFAAQAQELLLRKREEYNTSTEKQHSFASILVLDIRTICDNSPDDLKQALKAEAEEAAELVKGFGKSILRLLERLSLRNCMFAGYTEGCPLLFKLVQALRRTVPDVCHTLWLLHPWLPAKFVNTHLVGGRGSSRNGPQFDLNLVFETDAAQDKRLPMIRHAHPSGTEQVIETQNHVLLTALHGTTTADTTTTTTTTIEPYDPDYCNAMGKSLFLSHVTVEMSPRSKQYERLSEESTADLLVVTKKKKHTNTIDVDEPVDVSQIDWSTCIMHVGALILRGNRCVLARSLTGEWNGMRIPSVVPTDGQSDQDAVLCSVAEFTGGVDATNEVVHLPYIAPVMVYAPNSRPNVLMKLYPVYATQPPPDGPLEEADMEDDEYSYDWYTFANATKRLNDERSMAALYTISSALVEAANVGALPCKWGGVFGQEVVVVRTSNMNSATSAVVDTNDNNNPATATKQLTATVEEWQPSRQGDVLQDVRKANSALMERILSSREEKKEEFKLPVTLLSGFLGSGKTTLLSHILANYDGLRVAILVNDMGEINIDAALVKSAVSIRQREEHMVELSNGCICCTLREDLLVEVAKIAAEGVYDYLLIESTGVSEPMPVAETFTFQDSTGLRLGDIAQIDTLVTVVDGSRFLEELESLQSLRERDWQADPQDQRTISHLLCDQVEFANVIVLNKCDLLEREERVKVKRLIQSMNPSAKLVESTFSKVPLPTVLGTGLFSMTDAERHDGWLQEARIGEHTPETEEYGIGSFTYRAIKPFYPHLLYDALEAMIDQSTAPFDKCRVLRAKGFLWFANCPQLQGDFSLAGNHHTVLPGNPWWAEIEKADWPEGLEEELQHGLLWHEPHGDRQQEVVIIGQSLDKAAITESLNACLVSDDDMGLGQDAWYEICNAEGDPFAQAWDEAIQAMSSQAQEQAHSHEHGHEHNHD